LCGSSRTSRAARTEATAKVTERPRSPSTASTKAPALAAVLRAHAIPGTTLFIAGDGVDDAEKRSPAGCVLKLEEMLEATEAPAEGMLATHGGYRFLLRAFLRKASHDGTFFDPAIASKEDDLPIMKEHLAGAKGPRVVIAGHTHAAREICDGERVYLNTGTWSDLMRLPRLADRAAVERFAEALATNQVKRIRRLTYASVTAEGPNLWKWTSTGGVPVEALPDI
jgi:hypothetical protein